MPFPGQNPSLSGLGRSRLFLSTLKIICWVEFACFQQNAPHSRWKEFYIFCSTKLGGRQGDELLWKHLGDLDRLPPPPVIVCWAKGHRELLT
jgi:hypothetical protein